MKAGALRVGVAADCVMLEFLPGAADAGSTRVVMPTATAEALLARLQETLGPPPATAPRPDALEAIFGSVPAELAQRGTTPVNAPRDPAGDAAARLTESVRALGAPVRSERSFQVRHERLQAHRFLLTVLPHEIPGDAAAGIRTAARRMDMPPAVERWLDAGLAQASAVHFGFEGDAGRIVCKLYLEHPRDGTAAPVLLHEACKWTPGSPDHVVSQYHWHAGLDADGIAHRLRGLYGADAPWSLACALAVLRLGAERAGGTALQYLEVTEAGNPRRSFDLNLYDAGLAVRDAQEQLVGMRDHFALRPGRFQALYDQIKSKPLGHVAGGVHRDGNDFFNVYFGVTRWPAPG
jgi:tryptophan halogenase